MLSVGQEQWEEHQVSTEEQGFTRRRHRLSDPKYAFIFYCSLFLDTSGVTTSADVKSASSNALCSIPYCMNVLLTYEHANNK